MLMTEILDSRGYKETNAAGVCRDRWGIVNGQVHYPVDAPCRHEEAAGLSLLGQRLFERSC
jgi:hypothetical protein